MTTPNPFASFKPAGGDLLQRLPGDSGGGDSSPHNWALLCGSCKAILGPLGVFQDHHIAPDGRRHRQAHCTKCHSTTIVFGVKDIHLAPPFLAHGKCVFQCGSPVVEEAPKIVLA